MVIIRKAEHKDIDFIIESILAAERSGTDKCGFLLAANLNETEGRNILRNILEEDIDGCEYSLSSFFVAEVDSMPVATIGGWPEGINDSNLSSSIIKANLLGFYLPEENKKALFEKSALLEQIEIKRNKVYNIEYVYCSPNYRRKHLIERLMEQHVKEASKYFSSMQIQVFSNNNAAIQCYEKFGFVKIEQKICTDEDILFLMPGNEKILMEKVLI